MIKPPNSSDFSLNKRVKISFLPSELKSDYHAAQTHKNKHVLDTFHMFSDQFSPVSCCCVRRHRKTKRLRSGFTTIRDQSSRRQSSFTCSATSLADRNNSNLQIFEPNQMGSNQISQLNHSVCLFLSMNPFSLLENLVRIHTNRNQLRSVCQDFMLNCILTLSFLH